MKLIKNMHTADKTLRKKVKNNEMLNPNDSYLQLDNTISFFLFIELSVMSTLVILSLKNRINRHNKNSCCLNNLLKCYNSVIKFLIYIL